MKSRSSAVPAFLFFLISSIIVVLLFRLNGFSGRSLLEAGILPVQKNTFLFFSQPHQSEIRSLEEKNLELSQKLIEMKKIEQENQALHDQFQTQDINPQILLPAHIIAMPGFLPGITKVESFILDQGSTSGVAVGQAVIYKNNLIGKITEVTDHASKVRLISHTDIHFTAKDLNSGAKGIIRGSGEELMYLNNVLISEKLQVGDILITAGDQDIATNGFAPGLIIGKIISIDKKPSALFQTAQVQSFIHPISLSVVFVITQQ